MASSVSTSRRLARSTTSSSPTGVRLYGPEDDGSEVLI
jgi:hypothetical protein